MTKKHNTGKKNCCRLVHADGGRSVWRGRGGGGGTILCLQPLTWPDPQLGQRPALVICGSIHPCPPVQAGTHMCRSRGGEQRGSKEAGCFLIIGFSLPSGPQHRSCKMEATPGCHYKQPHSRADKPSFCCVCRTFRTTAARLHKICVCKYPCKSQLKPTKPAQCMRA